MANKVMTEKDWQADSDAETLARYEEIMSDSSRRNAAVKVAKQKAAELNKRANAMNRVAGNNQKSTSKKTQAKKK